MVQMGLDKDKIKKIVENIKEKAKEYYKKLRSKPLYMLNLAMVFLILIIMLLTLQFTKNNNTNDNLSLQKISSESDAEDIFTKCEDDKIYHFVYDFLEAKKYLDFVNIYRSFNKDYVTMKDTEEGKAYENGILYEHNLIKDYKNLQVYKARGEKKNEYVLVCLYDILTYYTEDTAPTMMTAYIIDEENAIYFKDDLDIGESKYITKVLEEKKVKDMYDETKKNLTRALANDSDLKLVYNSLRQYDMNGNNYLLDDKDKIIGRLFNGSYNKEKEYINLAKKKMENEAKSNADK